MLIAVFQALSLTVLSINSFTYKAVLDMRIVGTLKFQLKKLRYREVKVNSPQLVQWEVPFGHFVRRGTSRLKARITEQAGLVFA